MKCASLLFVCFFCLPILGVSAQDDPFAESDNKQSSDPFADSRDNAAADPFAESDGQVGDDPFAEPPNPKPAGKRGGGLSALGGSTERAAVTIDRQTVNERIRAALRCSTSQNFDDTPLAEVIRDLAETHDIPMVVDRRALEEIGLSEEEPVSIALDRVTLGSFLRLMLRDLDLTYLVQDEVLLITTQEAAVQNLVVRAYPMNHSLAGSSDQVANLMQTTVTPSAWTRQGGYATAVPILGNVVVVSATETLHERIEDLLQKLKDALGE
jgi:type II secretory pathway component GspD/PulD (secretin)